MARKYRERQINQADLSNLRKVFERDWEDLVHEVEINLQTMAALPGLVEQYPLKAADAIQLSAVLWLKNNMEMGKYSRAAKVLEFCVSDQTLADCGRKCGLVVFNPEEEC
jgi:hypothetical protein